MARIVAKDAVVEFPVYTGMHRSLKSAVLHASTGGRLARDAADRVTVRALDGVSFDIRAGDRVGLVGHNGAGKSTMLRMLCGIYEPIAGSLTVEGRVATLLELQLGIDPDATGYENIMLRGVMAGLKLREIRARIDEIAEFTELGDYLGMPVRTYSSGMLLRLAFAVSTSVEADILLMDEWLSVGDADFSRRASQRLDKLVERTPILVLASHSPALIRRLCTRVFRLAHGKLTEEALPPAAPA
jgi:lipopolysaccharide transport system ATP-binding protein